MYSLARPIEVEQFHRGSMIQRSFFLNTVAMKNISSERRRFVSRVAFNFNWGVSVIGYHIMSVGILELFMDALRNMLFQLLQCRKSGVTSRTWAIDAAAIRITRICVQCQPAPGI